MHPVLKFISSHDIIALKSPLHFVTPGLETHTTHKIHCKPLPRKTRHFARVEALLMY